MMKISVIAYVCMMHIRGLAKRHTLGIFSRKQENKWVMPGWEEGAGIRKIKKGRIRVSVSFGKGFLITCSRPFGQNGSPQTFLDCELLEVRDGALFTSDFSVLNTVPGAVLVFTTHLKD